MTKSIPKFLVMKMLEIFKKEGCNTIDEVMDLLNKEVKKDTDVVFLLEEEKPTRRND